jgi:hypothetical protein
LRTRHRETHERRREPTASRLQALTRDLAASVAIDEPKRARAGYVCANFVRHADVAIRG